MRRFWITTTTHETYVCQSCELLDGRKLTSVQVGSFTKNSKDVGIGLVGAPACGDVMKLSIKVNEAGIIEDLRFKTFGCGSAIASSSYMTERVKGLSLDEAAAIKNTEVARELSLPPVKLHCSMQQRMLSRARSMTTARGATKRATSSRVTLK